MKRYFFPLLIIASFLLTSSKCFSNQFYQITVYHFSTPQQEVMLDTYLQTALLPALHRNQIKNIGVFKPIANDTSSDKIIYVIVPFKSFADMQTLQSTLAKDAIYTDAAKDYITANYQNPPYARMEKIILTAFETAPTMSLPKLSGDQKDHVYELRSYESPTESYHTNKVKMFNSGEIDIFSKLNFNGVFYADVIAGSRMPNLMYLTSYDNMAERDAHWKAFTDDANAKKMFAMDEYKNNVSKADIILMHATSYSDY
jgi:hypothetical protein